MSNISAIVHLSNYKKTMEPLTNHRPVGALPFSGRYRIIDFILSSTSHANIESVAMFINSSGRSIYDHVRSGREWDLDSTIRGGLFTFPQEYFKKEYYHTYDETLNYYADHITFLKKSNDDYVVVQSGEVIHALDIKDMAQYHKNSNADISVAYTLECDNKHDFYVDENDRFVEETNHAKKALNLDIYFMKIDLLLEMFEKANEDDFKENVLDVINEYKDNYDIKAYRHKGYAAKIRSVQDFFNANISMLNEDIFKSLFYSDHPIITRARSGPPAYYGLNSEVKNAQIATGSSIYGKVHNSLIFRKVQVAEDAFVHNSIILTGTKIGKNVELNYVLTDKDVTIEDNVKLSGTADQVLVIKKGRTIKAGETI